MSAIKCSVRYFCFGALLIFIGSILLCALGFTYVLPHVATENWPEVNCTVYNATYNARLCSCEQQQADMDSDIRAGLSTNTEQFVEGESCLSRYPCLQVYVQYAMTSRVSDNTSEVTYRSAMLYRSWGDGFHNSCSLHECGDEEWNIKTVRKFRADWGKTGKNVTCYFNPEKTDMVISERTPASQMVHAIVWPCLCLGAGSFIWLGLCMGCWTIEMDKYKYRYPHRYPALDRSLL